MVNDMSELAKVQPAAESGAFVSGCPVSHGTGKSMPVPLGPESLTWKYFGDWRGMLQGPYAGSMQRHAPAVGCGRRAAFAVLPRALAAVVAFAIPDRRSGIRRGPGADDRG